jgi:hypothetical protein
MEDVKKYKLKKKYFTVSEKIPKYGDMDLYSYPHSLYLNIEENEDILYDKIFRYLKGKTIILDDRLYLGAPKEHDITIEHIKKYFNFSYKKYYDIFSNGSNEIIRGIYNALKKEYKNKKLINKNKDCLFLISLTKGFEDRKGYKSTSVSELEPFTFDEILQYPYLKYENIYPISKEEYNEHIEEAILKFEGVKNDLKNKLK